MGRPEWDEYSLDFFMELSQAGVLSITVDRAMAFRLFWGLVKSDTWASKISRVEDLHNCTIYNCRIVLGWL